MGNPKGRINGKNLGHRGLMAEALLKQGFSIRKTSKLAGISPTSASELRRKTLCDPMRADAIQAIRNSLRDQFTLTANACLEGIDQAKIKKASASELMRAAAQAADRCGIEPASTSERHNNYFFQQTNIQQAVITNGAPLPVTVTPSTREPA
jgi:hypothetical protein